MRRWKLHSEGSDRSYGCNVYHLSRVGSLDTFPCIIILKEKGVSKR